MELTAFAFEVWTAWRIITMNQPDRGNPFDERFAEEFERLATECAVRPDVRAVLDRREGRFFSVGGDLNALTRSRENLARFVSGVTSESAYGHLAFRASQRAGHHGGAWARRGRRGGADRRRGFRLWPRRTPSSTPRSPASELSATAAGAISCRGVWARAARRNSTCSTKR